MAEKRNKRYSDSRVAIGMSERKARMERYAEPEHSNEQMLERKAKRERYAERYGEGARKRRYACPNNHHGGRMYLEHQYVRALRGLKYCNSRFAGHIACLRKDENPPDAEDDIWKCSARISHAMDRRKEWTEVDEYELHPMRSLVNHELYVDFDASPEKQ